MRTTRFLPPLILPMLLMACGGAPEARDEPSNIVASPNPTPAPSPAAPPARASRAEAKTDDYSFAYAYPAQAAAIAPLRAWLDGERDRERARLEKDTSEARREAETDGFPYRPHESTTEWKVVTTTPTSSACRQSATSIWAGRTA